MADYNNTKIDGDVMEASDLEAIETAIATKLDVTGDALEDCTIGAATPSTVVATDIKATLHIYFDAEFDNGNSGAADTIDWGVGNKQKSTLTGNCTYTFTAPDGPCNLILKLVQDATGSRTVTWPATAKWEGGTAPTLSTAGSSVDLVSFYYDGTNYYGMTGFNFS